MILFLCYVCPPFAVLCMGRPFSAVLNMFFTCFFWVPGVSHALVCYADYKVNGITRAVHRPKWTSALNEQSVGRIQGRTGKKAHVETVVLYDNPHVGKGGTYFRPKN